MKKSVLFNKACNIFSLNYYITSLSLGYFLRTGLNEASCHTTALQYSLSPQVWHDI